MFLHGVESGFLRRLQITRLAHFLELDFFRIENLDRTFAFQMRQVVHLGQCERIFHRFIGVFAQFHLDQELNQRDLIRRTARTSFFARHGRARQERKRLALEFEIRDDAR